MAIKYPKHSLSIYNLQAYKTLRKTAKRPKTKQLFEIDAIPNILNKDLKKGNRPHNDLDLYEILKAFFNSRTHEVKKTKTGNVAYKHDSYDHNDKGRWIIARIDRGDYGTYRTVESINSALPNTNASIKSIETHEAPLEPFYLGFFIPKGYQSAFFFAPKRGNINLRSLFWSEFKDYFKSVANCQIECDLLLTGQVYKQWLKADVTEIVAHQEVYLAPQDIADRLTDKKSLARYQVYQQKISIKPDPSNRNKLHNFIKVKKDSVVLLKDTYTEAVKEYDQVRVIASQDGKQQSFPIKSKNQDLTQQFYIDLPGLDYSSKGHPQKKSVIKEYKAVYNTYKEHLKKA